ncbi:hypothetical protein Lalb_Chr13g0296141 [Lupinus albus]|uniref:Uncharacterized protein n=1 Tax=Lupinus albus TaxID=3870 RepID=A0A6A4PI99_LUPAL|nr:hypothetical protein Lalb_Chr13g0296141 [Lupinus albus]
MFDHISIANTLIPAYAKCGDLCFAEIVFDYIGSCLRSVVSICFHHLRNLKHPTHPIAIPTSNLIHTLYALDGLTSHSKGQILTYSEETF